jgi:hypothetical protein
MSFNRTVKYYRTIRAYVYCDICKDVIGTDIVKEDIRNGLQTGLYIYKYVHKNLHHDVEDTEDKSWMDHTTAVYINGEYEVKGIKNYFGEFSVENKGGAVIPICVKDIPPMSVHLGMLSPEEYRILQLCDGNNTLDSVAEIASISRADLDKMMDKLKDKGLVNLIKRS